jgi:hypothetical protein
VEVEIEVVILPSSFASPHCGKPWDPSFLFLVSHEFGDLRHDQSSQTVSYYLSLG